MNLARCACGKPMLLMHLGTDGTVRVYCRHCDHPCTRAACSHCSAAREAVL